MRGSTAGRFRRGAWLVGLTGLLVISFVRPASAVRPFVTDDARIIDKGQVEVESWVELVRANRRLYPGLHSMAGVSFTHWFELIVGAGLGLDGENRVTIANPVIQPKFLVFRAQENGIPGLAFGVGATLPWGRGDLFEEATGLYTIGMVTSRLFEDWLLLHVNFGFTSALIPPAGGHGREYRAFPYWGFGFDVGIGHPDARLIGEAYAGDPLEPLGPRHSYQWGARWIASDYVNLDLTFGAQPDEGVEREGRQAWQWWGQIGLRLLFDVFTDGRGDPMGARGMVRPPFASSW